MGDGSDDRYKKAFLEKMKKSKGEGKKPLMRKVAKRPFEGPQVKKAHIEPIMTLKVKKETKKELHYLSVEDVDKEIPFPFLSPCGGSYVRCYCFLRFWHYPNIFRGY